MLLNENDQIDNSMRRCFQSRKEECSGGCKYCFGKWKKYVKYLDVDYDQDNMIIYPNCDGDYFDTFFFQSINKLKAITSKNIIVSVSTKFDITETTFYELMRLNHSLRNNNRGFLKLSVSFSCTYSIPDIEPNTASYQVRLKTIRNIVNNGIPYATMIKPVLPFVSINEYKTLVNDTISMSPYYILGDLYVDEETAFFEKYIAGQYKVQYRDVSWNKKDEVWGVVESKELKDEIEAYIVDKGGLVFHSDTNALLRIQKDNEMKS